MAINKAVVAYMSPTGGTKRVALNVRDAILKTGIDLSCFNFLSKKDREIKTEFSKEHLVFFHIPVYFGRMPWALKDWNSLNGNGAKAFIGLVYGNRACEDAGREFAKFLTDRNFQVIGYAEFVAEHSQYRLLAQNRPDEDDCLEIKKIAMKVLERAKELADDDKIAYKFDYSTPYRDYGQVPFVPQILRDEWGHNHCLRCSVCRNICPMGIIEENFTIKEENKHLCMGCRACVSRCKAGLRNIPDEVLDIIDEKMSKIYEQNKERKPNKYYLV